MKLTVCAVDPAEWRRLFPEDGDVAGWRFRTVETSSGVYLVEGSDRFGRLVSRRGEDPDRLLEDSQEDARTIQRQLTDFSDNQAFYDSVSLLCMDLERASCSDLARRVREAMASGGMATEVLGALRNEFRRMRRDPNLPKTFRPRVARYVEVLDKAFDAPERA